MSEENKSFQINLCWYVGAVWNDKDMTDKFISEGYWENGWDDKFTSLVNQIQVGDKIVIKSSFTQKNNLPFDIKGGTASVMSVKCVGTVTKNYNNGKRVDVDWAKDYEQRNWFFFTGRTTIWKVERNPNDWMYGALLDFTFNNAEQNYNDFLAHPYWASKYKLIQNNSDEKYLTLIEEYKTFLKKNKKVAFDDEVYKWELLTQNKGKNGVDLINAVRSSKNLIYQSDAATLKTLVERVPDELVQIVENLLDESSDLIARLSDFKRDMKALVQKTLDSTNYAEDERTAADYLTYSYPEKYTFYTNEIYVAYCKYLGIETRKTGEIYPHYCELLHKLESFVSKDDELLEMIANNSSNYMQSDLLLSQNIVYVMLKEKYLYQKNGETSMIESEKRAQEFAKLLKNTKNLILHGAPGTGKTYLAQKEIAPALAKEFGLAESDVEVEFVQFHPSYDYTDFVEGIRPRCKSDDDSADFELVDGVFKKFCERALKDSRSNAVDNFDEVWERLITELSEKDFITVPLFSGRDSILIELNEYGDGLANRTYENGAYEKGKWIRGQSKFFSKDQCYNIYRGLPGIPSGGHDNYRKAVVKYMKDSMGLLEYQAGTIDAGSKKTFVFIIDEINRGELSKIFGELFFAIDPDYRGAKNCANLLTQYANMQKTPNAFDSALGERSNFGHFFVPENVHIIGTMNDIDRSVESMDLAMRRRFTFKEITAEESRNAMLTKENPKLSGFDDNIIEELRNRMTNLNNVIVSEEIGLPVAYQIGAAYFLKYANYKNGDTSNEEAFCSLWKYNLEPLLREYLRGQDSDDKNLGTLRKAYNNTSATSNDKSSANIDNNAGSDE